MERATGKAERLLQIEALLLAHPEGLTQAEIGRRLGVNRSTINRYLPGLGRFSIHDTDDGRLAIDRDQYLTRVRLTLHEAMALHLAARLMTTRTDKHNPHAASALRKLGLALERLAPLISRHLAASADVMDDEARRHDPVYLEVLETLTRAWSQGRMVHLWHRHERGRVDDYDFAPYFIEPYAVGQTTHVIGWREPPGAVRTFKVERIQRIELTARSYTIPDDFDPRKLLADAWGIWYTEAEPAEVVLRFHPRVAGRVRETRWHRSEQIEEQADGSLIWRARVAEPQEMLPWIRGWGADVEVLEPEELRERVAGETQRLTALYEVGGVASPPPSRLLWGKASRKTGSIHRLVYHLVDVGQVALALWQEGLNEGVRQQLAGWLGLSVDEAGRLIAFWAGLHDLGKASPIFQYHPYAPQRVRQSIEPELEIAGLLPPQQSFTSFSRHEIISTWALERQGKTGLLVSEAGLSRFLSIRIAAVLGGHHGTWPKSNALDHDQLWPQHLGSKEWQDVRADLVREMKSLFEPPQNVTLNLAVSQTNTLLTLLSGLISVADWIGSNEDFFGHKESIIPLKDYAELASCRANKAMRELGWLAKPRPTGVLTFEQAFDKEPRPVQQEVIQATASLGTPALVVLEAPTGIGKTEAALYLAEHWAQSGDHSGLYVAMPTTATSNQMYDRVTVFLKRRYGDHIEPLLVHSQAMLREDEVQTLTTDQVEEEEKSQNEDRTTALTWFLPRKKSLLAPFGIGTVDQALMSVLQTKHFFVRLLGLSHKVVIFDEVHAYDTYMSTLFKRLLEWLREIGASVIVLSATLPAGARRELVAAYLGKDNVTLDEKPYPRLTCAARHTQPFTVELPPPDDRTLALEWMERTPSAIAARLKSELCDGGCAAVICNTVNRAQEVYQEIRDSQPGCEIILFHAHFPYIWRKEIEDNVLRKFGPRQDPDKENPERPGKAIVVATQVIEQSLDLDFDLMITDLAPLDLLLQRAGRLHRHEYREHRLPYRLIVAHPEIQDGLPTFDRDIYVYEKHVLLASYLTLRGRPSLQLPTETSELIEQVYGGVPIAALTLKERTELENTKRGMDETRAKHERQAQGRLVREPWDEELLWGENLALEEDDPTVHRAFQALTRKDAPGLSVVCLHRTERGLVLDPDKGGPVIDLNAVLLPSPEQVLQLLKGVVVIRRQAVIDHCLEQKDTQPPAWKKIPALRYHRLAIFERGVYNEISSHQLQLSRELGLKVVPRKELS